MYFAIFVSPKLYWVQVKYTTWHLRYIDKWTYMSNIYIEIITLDFQNWRFVCFLQDTPLFSFIRITFWKPSGNRDLAVITGTINGRVLLDAAKQPRQKIYFYARMYLRKCLKSQWSSFEGTLKPVEKYIYIEKYFPMKDKLGENNSNLL
jgi:hypothetical protein